MSSTRVSEPQAGESHTNGYNVQQGTTVKRKNCCLRPLFGASPLVIGIFVLFWAAVAMAVGLLVHYYDHAHDDDVTPAAERFTPDPYEPLDYRLPRDFVPVHYDIEIKADFYAPKTTDQFKFDGWSTAWLQCNVSTDWVTLHIRQLTITAVVVRDSSNQVIAVTETARDDEREFYKLRLARSCVKDEVISVATTYWGPLLRDMMGLYYSQYVVNDVTKYMVGTQFEATDARKAFPCMDEPTFKQTFNVSLWKRSPMIAFSNMPNYTTEDMSSTDPGWDRVKFQKTPVKMTTYLVAFAVAEYSYVENVTKNGLGAETPVRIVSRPDALAAGQGDFINQYAVVLMGWLEDWFQFPFPMPKLDHISIPDFAAGAMENWGLITYRESRLLFDPAYCGELEREYLTVTFAHEIVHMWTGDVATCDWWSHIWTQEGSASYWEHWSTQYAHPDWDMTQIFLARTEYAALRADDNANLHPLHVPVYSAAEAEAVFTTISYDKGASIIRMVEHLFLGSTNFHNAMIDYINTNQYKTVTYKTLVAAWAGQSAQPGNNMKGVSLTDAAYTWIEQLGFPIIFLRRLDSVTVQVTQHMLLEYPERPVKDAQFPSPYDYTWYVPVSYVTKAQPTVMDTYWLQRNNGSITLSTPLASNDWILGNYKAYGFYRVNYDNSNWDSLIAQLQTDHTVFDVSNRGQLIHDSMAFGKAGDLDHLRGLEASLYLTSETEWLPWYAFDQSQAFVDWVLSDTKAYEDYKSFIRLLVSTQYSRLGWNDSPSEPLLTKHLRTLILNLACVYEDSDCVTQALSLFNQWKNSNGLDYTIIRPDIRRSVVCTAIAYSTVDSWYFVMSEYTRWRTDWMGPDSVDRIRYRNALTCSRNPSTLRLLFDMAATLHSDIHPSDALSILVTIATSVTGNDVAWDYLNEMWDSMIISRSARITILENTVLRFTSEFDKARLTTFFAQHPPLNYAEQDRYDSMMFMVDSNVRWQAANYDIVAAWLASLPHPRAATR